MIQAHSSQRGIIFSDPSVEGSNAVYCWQENGHIEVLEGTHDELTALFKQEKKADEITSDKDPHGRLMLKLLLLGIVFVIAVAWLTDGAAPVVGAIVFAVVGWFPSYALASVGMHEYADDDIFQQFRRNHGAEHVAFAHYRKKKRTWDLADLRNHSHLDPECGTVYIASLLLWAAIAGVSIAQFAQIGMLKLIGILLGSAIAILVNNWFNPINPLKLAQKRSVAKPGDQELLMAAAGMQAFLRLVEKDEDTTASN